MSGTVSTRWFWSDWMSDPGLRACGYAARGLWKDLLCIAGANKTDYGFVSLNGRNLSDADLARMTNGTETEVAALLEELAMNGVFSRDRRGMIYCRRMVRAEKNRINGRLGGNPNLLKSKDNTKSVKRNPKALIPEPEPEPVLKEESLFLESGEVSGPKDDYPKDGFDQFWKLYPIGRKSGKKAAASKFDGIHRRREVTFGSLMAGLQRYVDSNPDPQYTKAPEVWLNKGCWDDEYFKKGGSNGQAQATGDIRKAGFAGIAARLRYGAAEPDRPSPENLEPINRR